MGRSAPAQRGEFILLALFGSFIFLYLFEIREVPMEGKILSYLLAPLLIGLLATCAIQAVVSRRRSATVTNDRADEPGGEEAALLAPSPAADRVRKARLTKTVVLGVVLYACVWLFGFYYGSGLMLLAWFAAFQRLNRTTLVITAVTPVVLYLLFEVVMQYGLYEGIVIEYLQR
ncbi:MAG: tripartite tricarboxylate transporter TctB family protein [Deferrisomatales bacterium]|nr:tripartite tricarboxylate transporter TctB family protein [Deferrisomatales bacterium]